MIITSCKDKTSGTMTESELLAKAEAIHDRVITIDTHCDIDLRNFTDSINYTQDVSAQVNLPKMKAGGLDVPWFIVYTGQDSLNDEGYAKAYDNAMAKFDAIHRLVNDYAPDQIELALTSDDVRQINEAGKKAAMIGIENGYPIGLDISNVKKFYDLGARYMSLAHNGHSQLSDSNTGEEDGYLHNGLSELGKQVIEEMNKYGMLIDISHPSKEAIRQMIELSKAPVIASHSSARTLCDHSRNLDDEQLEWVKNNGGVVQTVAFQAYVNKEKSDARSEKLNEIQSQLADSLDVRWFSSFREFRNSDMTQEERNAWFPQYMRIRDMANKMAEENEDFPPQVNVSDFVDHIDYLVDKIGLKHVGISSDFDGGGGVEGWSDASETMNVTVELVKRGYSEDEIAALWGGNLLRALDEAQAIAKSLQSE
ncbi:MAG: membrane dipeptidase [Flavobacteriaceae bacterium]|nr:dipeptidase [Bacteroidia bacterium]NNF74601.1 membrane dipeptidase [Flavobacteriaceae bacterium]NNK73524.1 membrane dipeptidase [Flavobacteriaceae bacterium]